MLTDCSFLRAMVQAKQQGGRAKGRRAEWGPEGRTGRAGGKQGMAGSLPEKSVVAWYITDSPVSASGQYRWHEPQLSS